jgi:hypothetical protein
MFVQRTVRSIVLLACLLTTQTALAGDTDGDGVPDGVDACCNTPPGTAVDGDGRPVGDLDGDCDVDLQDYALLAQNLTGPLVPVACASCSDLAQNGDETDIDCGGGDCPPCQPGEGCLVAVDCTTFVCQFGTCLNPSCSDGVQNGSETGADCGGGVCPPCAPGQGCLAGSDCTSFVCQFGFCLNPSCSDGVQNGGETGVDCGGPCAPCPGPDGTACSNHNQCLSGLCVDGVCCNTACSSTCQRCNLAGSVGSCANIAQGLDPDNECANGACDGLGSCALNNGLACANSGQCVSGQCVDGVCCSTACNATCQRCNLAGTVGSCANIPFGTDPDNECANGTCNGSGSCSLDNGLACTSNSQCVSGQCVDGVCCNTACNSTCQRCNLAGSVGTCANIVVGQDPDNECANGTCNGSGSCALDNGLACTTNSQCVSGQCVDGVCCNTACNSTCQRCNLAGTVGSCANIPFGTDPDNECAGAQTCNGTGGCQP